MTDKERYEFAMRENHELREQINGWKEAHKILHKQLAHALYRWATATRVAYASKGYGGIARRWVKVQEKFKRAWEGLK